MFSLGGCIKECDRVRNSALNLIRKGVCEYLRSSKLVSSSGSLDPHEVAAV